MRFTLAFACQLVAVLALPAETYVGGQRVLYIQDNDPSGNSILAHQISNTDGTLSSGVRTSTGGYGLDLLIVASQDSVVVSGNVWNVISFLFNLKIHILTSYCFSVSVHSERRKQYLITVCHRSLRPAAPSTHWKTRSHSRPDPCLGYLLAQAEDR
jgi:hypothetical protein